MFLLRFCLSCIWCNSSVVLLSTHFSVLFFRHFYVHSVASALLCLSCTSMFSLHLVHFCFFIQFWAHFFFHPVFRLLLFFTCFQCIYLLLLLFFFSAFFLMHLILVLVFNMLLGLSSFWCTPVFTLFGDLLCLQWNPWWETIPLLRPLLQKYSSTFAFKCTPDQEPPLF